MTDTTLHEVKVRKNGGKVIILMAIVLSVILGGVAYYLVSSNRIPFLNSAVSDAPYTTPTADSGAIAFVPLDPIMITFETGRDRVHLRFRTQLEVPKSATSNVEALVPRVVDVFNTFLRALSLDELQAPAALTKLRAQMLRRARLVLGDDQINDVLIMEFVLD